MSDIAHSTLQALRQQNVPLLFHYDDLLCNARKVRRCSVKPLMPISTMKPRAIRNGWRSP